MNDNTILRIKVPANLYESVKKQLTLNEAKKSGHNYGAGMEVVKEKKMQTHKDGMKKVEEMKDSKKPHSLEELKAVKEKLEKKINEMEKASKDTIEEVGAGVEFAWIPAAVAALGITTSIGKLIVKYMKDNNLTGIKGFLQAYQEVGKRGSSAIDQSMTGGTGGIGEKKEKK
jgi:hypothetical protein